MNSTKRLILCELKAYQHSLEQFIEKQPEEIEQGKPILFPSFEITMYEKFMDIGGEIWPDQEILAEVFGAFRSVLITKANSQYLRKAILENKAFEYIQVQRTIFRDTAKSTAQKLSKLDVEKLLA